MILELNRRKLLIDCGTDIRFSLAKELLTYKDITDIYISHLHADHVGGLEYIGFNTYFDPSCDRPRIYAATPLLELLWDRSLKGGMKDLNGKTATLSTYFDPIHLEAEEEWVFEGLMISPVKTCHVHNGLNWMPSYGLLIEGKETKNTFLSTDTKLSPNLKGHYNYADLIFHDCETACASSVHAHYPDLAKLPSHQKRKMWLYGHHGDFPDAEKDEFLGFVKRGQVFYLDKREPT